MVTSGASNVYGTDSREYEATNIVPKNIIFQLCMPRLCHSIVHHTNTPAPVLMNDQAGKLSDLIKDRCAAAHARKKQLRMLANTEKLQFYRKELCSSFSDRFSGIVAKRLLLLLGSRPASCKPLYISRVE